MKPTAEDIERSQLIGYVGSDGVLYCSGACAARRGQPDAAPVDQAEYDALVDRGEASSATLCPVCGREFAAAWPDDERP